MKNVLLQNLSIWILSSIFITKYDCITFDYGLVNELKDINVVEKFQTIDIMANLTEHLLSHNVHNCVKDNLQKEEISAIDEMLRDEFEDFLDELNLFFPKNEETLWYLTLTNCYLYESICGSHEKSCCIHDRDSDKDFKACLDGDYTGKAMQILINENDKLLYTSICVRETIPFFENFVAPKKASQ